MKKNLSRKESKRERFVRLAELRVNRILDEFRKLGNLSDPRNYEYTNDDVLKIFNAINKEIRRTKELFYARGNSKITRFKL